MARATTPPTIHGAIAQTSATPMKAVSDQLVEVPDEAVVHGGPQQRMATPAPSSAARSVSMMNGKRMVKFEAPTSRMIPVSRRRLKAACRIVVDMSRTAHSTMSAARTIATTM